MNNFSTFQGEPMTGRKATDQWYREVATYDFNNKVFSPTTGHFTQVRTSSKWKETVLHKLKIFCMID